MVHTSLVIDVAEERPSRSAFISGTRDNHIDPYTIPADTMYFIVDELL